MSKLRTYLKCNVNPISPGQRDLAMHTCSPACRPGGESNVYNSHQVAGCIIPTSRNIPAPALPLSVLSTAAIKSLTDNDDQHELARADRPVSEDRALAAGRRRNRMTYLPHPQTSHAALGLENEPQTHHGPDRDDRKMVAHVSTTDT